MYAKLDCRLTPPPSQDGAKVLRALRRRGDEPEVGDGGAGDERGDEEDEGGGRHGPRDGARQEEQGRAQGDQGRSASVRSNCKLQLNCLPEMHLIPPVTNQCYSPFQGRAIRPFCCDLVLFELA